MRGVRQRMAGADWKAAMADGDDFAAARTDAVEYPITAMDDSSHIAVREFLSKENENA